LKTLTLNHSFTPSLLKIINQDLLELTSDVDPDESKFLRLVTQRDEFIQSYLQTLEKKLKNDFVNAEIKVNGVLVAHAEESFKASLKQLSGLVRGRKAVKKYK
jgi:CRISPR/Cas system endoribonuclease Cas6 (RAMP superfamily)